MRKKWQIILIIGLLLVTLNWLPEIAQAHKATTGVTYTTQTSTELMELFLTYSLDNPHIEIMNDRAELMFETEENATISVVINNQTKKVTGSSTYHQFTIAHLKPGNNLITITTKSANQQIKSKTITINLPEKPKKDSKSFHHKSTNENFYPSKKRPAFIK
ncbi:hypothetical protein C1903_01355 [Listeria ivanovii]|nr:hypothetical protein C1905_01750 [Listeria ivanovii]PZF96591.1 hypothetical protein C1903_01355 [Listeria ivanovii]PZG06702.1 hypothetical protein C2L88_01345 [Listeria ivanovii]PZG11641.1 hypothetical protein C1901_01350 [Listeria ivanovii]PZG28480.1 hypothetical protein C1900_01755 [Listeria ivanovii]